MSDFEQDVDERLDALNEKENELSQSGYLRSATRVANEIRRVARAEKRVIAYLNATFTVMNHAIDLLEPEVGRDAAIEIISLLESEDRARTIQPDLPEWEYEQSVHWLTPCGYDNLAKATAVINGYNSDGIHACIADGIQVCRQTGKLQCITCFREYAADVYRAADDLDMAIHYSRAGIAHEDPGPHDRRWTGAKDLTLLMIRTGKLDAAAESVERARELCETWHSPITARLDTKLLMEEVAHLLGDPSRWDGAVLDNEPPQGEYPWLEMRRDQVQAVAACCEGNFDDAITILSDWDQKLMRNRCLDDWFGTRLRLLAAHRMAGNESKVERLAEQLEAKARPARDWLTLRCLERLLDSGSSPAPVPVVTDLNSGPFGKVAANDSRDSVTADHSTKVSSDEDTAHSETSDGPPEIVEEFWNRMGKVRMAFFEEAETDDSFDLILADVLAVDPVASYSDEERQWLLHTVRYLIGNGERGREVWSWAKTLTRDSRNDAVTLSLFATLGSALAFGESDELSEIVTEEQLEQMFRESLDLDSASPKNFGRAGDFFRFMENLGEAERCYARGFRLDRSNSNLAKELAGIYRRTERERDALAVLDMALREGSEDPDLAWSAAISAHQLEQYQATLTYLDEYEQHVPDQPWVNYYRASALLALDRPTEALVAAEAEATNNPDCPFTVAVFRAVAAAKLERHEQFRELLAEVLQMRLPDIDYLTPSGLCSMMLMLWNCVGELQESDELRQQFEDRAVAGGIAPNELFTKYRETNEPSDNVNFYECVLRQPLDDSWTNWHGRLAHEDDAAAYTVTWGVLALSEEAAVSNVLQWQSRAFPLPASVVQVDLCDEGYRDSDGVVWQGFRETEIR